MSLSVMTFFKLGWERTVVKGKNTDHARNTNPNRAITAPGTSCDINELPAEGRRRDTAFGARL